MSDTALTRSWSARVWYATFMVVISFIAAIGLLLWQPWSASAVVTEDSVVDLVKLNGTNTIKPGSFFPIVKFNLTPNAGETLVSTTFRVNAVSGFVSTTLNRSGSLAGGSAILLVRDTNNSGAYETQGDTSIGGITGSMFETGTSTLTVDTDLNFGNGAQAETITTSSYFIVLVISSTSTEGHIFSVTIPTGTAAYVLNSGSVTSAGLNTANVTIDSTVPAATASAVPPNGQEFVPVDTFVQRSFGERLATSTVTTTGAGATIKLQANTDNTQSGVPTSTNLCTALTTLQSAGTTILCPHSTLATSTWYTFTITTGTTDVAGNALAAAVTSTFKTGDLSAQNNVTPPFVVSTVPTNANTSFPTNGTIYIEFPASLAGVMSVSGDGSVTSTSNVLLQAVSNGAPTGSNLLTNISQLSVLATGVNSPHWLQVSPPSLSANTNYALTIKKNVKNFNGVPLNSDFILNFKTSAGTDSIAPIVSSITPASSTTGVAHNVGDVVVNFSKDMNGATITTTSLRFFRDANSNSVLDANEWWSASTTVRYDSMQKAAHIGLKTILAANSQYCIHAATSTDLAGNALTSAVRCFTSNAAAFSATSPTVMFADADNFKLWVSFDQPVDPNDAVASANYSVESPIGTTLNLANAGFNYRPEGKGVEITSIGLTTGQQYQVTVTGVRDLSAGATIVANGTTNVAKGVVQDSTKTGGLVGGLDKADFTQTNFGTFWQNPQRCAPSSSGAGKRSRLMCEFPAPAALSTGAQIILTFPTGFDINVMSLIATSSSQMNADLNGFGPGVTRITSIATNTTANTVILTLAHTGTAMTSNDQLRFELDNIINHMTQGSYSVTIVTKDSNGIKQGQTITAAPFMISTAGSLAIGGKVCKGTTSGGGCTGDDTGISGAKVFLDSPASGHMETSTAAGGTYTFPGLTAGQYAVGVFIDPSVSADLGGGNNFQSVTLSGANATGIDFKKTDVSSSGKTLTFVITGGPAATDMDVFCFAPSSVQFSAPVMKMVTTNGSGATTTALKVQPNTTYQCGVGPHMPFDSISSGAAPTMPDFSFVPPPPQQVVIGTTNATTTIALTVATEQILGKITDGTGTAIANVYVDARPTGCFDTSTGALKDCRGGMAQSKTDGKFTLKVTAGTYQVSACAPGMPCSSPVEVTVKANASGVDNNSAADVYMGGTLVTSANGVVIRMVKSSLTIAGQVLDESGNALKYAFVNARRVGSSDTCTSYTAQGGDTGSPTDSQGNYTLYVTNTSTWRVEAYAGSYGSVGCSIVTVTNSSLSSQNIQATASSYGTISGTVTRDSSTSTQGAQVNCFGSSGGNQTIVGADGTYSMKVKAGTYTCDGFIPGSGSLTPATGVVVTGSGTATANLSMGNPGKIVVTLGSTMTDAFCDARSSSGYGNGTSQNSSGTYTINVPAGTYTVRCGNPRTGELGSQSVTATAGATSTVTFTAPTLFTVTGRVTDGSNNLEGASITFSDKTNGRIIFKQANATSGSSANVSVSLPAGTYSVVASKAGYVDADSAQSLTVSADTTFTTRSLTKATATASVTVQSDGVNYTGQAKVIATRSSDSKVVTGDVDATVTSTANATLALTTGSWSVQAFGDNGKKSSAATITVTGASVSASPTLSLSTTITGFTSSQNQQSMVPSNGGLFKDSGINSKFEINIPAGALSTSDATAGTIETKKNATYAISTPGKSFLGTAAIDITPKNSSGQKISDLSSAVTFTIPYSEADIPSGVDERDLLCAAWSDASQEWETLPTTVDTTNNILTCQTTHFSTFGAIAPTSGGTVAASTNTSPSSSGGGSAATVPIPVVRANATAPVVVNRGALETTSRMVELHFAVDKATQMAISNTPDFTGQSYGAYSDTKTWELTPGLGQKTVYVRFRTAEGGMLVASASVNLVDQMGAATPSAGTTSPARQPVTLIKIVPAASTKINDLKPGSRGAEVLALQAKLKALGHLSKSVKSLDNYGPATTAAVKRFQKANKLPMNGVVSGKTTALLNDSTDSSAVVPTSAPVSLSPLPSPMPIPPGVFKNLKPGSRGASVLALQEKLKALGFLSSSVKSVDNYGPATTAAVKRFQKANNISQTGSIGPLTLSSLNRQ